MQPTPPPAPADDHPPATPATLAVTAGRPPRVAGGPLNAPVDMSSTYLSQGVPQPGEPLYARMGTPSWDGFERALGQLEGAELDGLVLGSGMAAVAATMSLVPAGGRLVLPRHAYQVTRVLAADLAERSGVRVEIVDIADTAAVIAAVQGTGRSGDDGSGDDGPAAMLWIESPTNPMLEVADLPALCAAANAVGTLVGVDNTFATPLRQQPLRLGADVVVHSVTKFLSGHSDLVLGAVATDDPALRERLHTYRTVHGAIAGPWETWLALRGLRTLAVRLDRAEASAGIIARRLAEHPAVSLVRYPGLPSDPGHARSAAQASGPGAMLGAEVLGGAVAADAVVAALQLWAPATSLGGVESTVERRRRFPTESRTVPENLLRMSVGIEDVEDLWADLDRALRRIG